MIQKKILVLDDDNDWYDALKEHLEMDGYEVVGCTTVEAGLDRLNWDKVDLVISDVWIGRDTSLRFIRTVRQHPKHKDLPIVLYTGADSVARLAEQWGVPYVTKDESIYDLLDQVQKLVPSGQTSL